MDTTFRSVPRHCRIHVPDPRPGADPERPGGGIGLLGVSGRWGAPAGASDRDHDTIPDLIDPYASDPWNNTYAYWEGGNWKINGEPIPFAARSYGGFPSPDTDGDGIPDCFDPYPGDFTNNPAWWNGGTFLLNGIPQSLAG